jgi:hypothetical protein
MFLTLIDDINALQQSKRKKLISEDDFDLNPPLTTDNLKSDRLSTNVNESDHEKDKDTVKIKK